MNNCLDGNADPNFGNVQRKAYGSNLHVHNIGYLRILVELLDHFVATIVRETRKMYYGFLQVFKAYSNSFLFS